MIIKKTFKDIPNMGIIWVTDEAIKLGYNNGNPRWVNMGQGQPEFGEMEGAPDRIKTFRINVSDNAYGPLNGMLELREAIANHYNRLYRKDKISKYKAENVSVAMGGRLVLTQIFTLFANIRLGYKTPEYPAYADILANHKGRIDAIHIPTTEANNYSIPANEFEKVILQNKLDAFLLSNPCNPTGQVIKNTDLKKYLTTANKNNCALIIDEMYSHYIYEGNEPALNPVSSAEFINNVDQDEVIIIDGLTKSFRYPGWRMTWAVGPKNIIENLGKVASATDGGPSMPMQRATLKVLEPKLADRETIALRKIFSQKKNIMVKSLSGNGIICSPQTNGTFYIWGNISQLPPPLNNSDIFFKEALKHKVITIPGHVFDIHLERSQTKNENFGNYIRFSFGPEKKNLIKGLAKISKMIKSFNKQ
jgi:aspartate/methionine/tyrosine aminotransferase